MYTRYSPAVVDALKWALEQGFTVDIGIETNLRAGEGAWEDMEEFLTKARPEEAKGGKIILCAYSLLKCGVILSSSLLHLSVRCIFANINNSEYPPATRRPDDPDRQAPHAPDL